MTAWGQVETDADSVCMKKKWRCRHLVASEHESHLRFALKQYSHLKSIKYIL